MPKIKNSPLTDNELLPDAPDKTPGLDDVRRMLGMMSSYEAKHPGIISKADPELVDAAALLVRKSLQLYGTIYPPRSERVAVIPATCSQCGHVGPAYEDFGFIVRKSGTRDPNAWCKTCRAEAVRQSRLGRSKTPRPPKKK